MFKLDLEEAWEPEIKLPTSVGSKKRQESSRQTTTSASLTTLKPLTVWITTNWKILQELGIPDYLTCLLRNLYVGQEATVRTGHGNWEQWTHSKLGKEYVKAVYCHPAYLRLCRVYIMRNATVDESQTGIKLAGRHTNSIRYAYNTILMTESEEEVNSLLMKVRKE